MTHPLAALIAGVPRWRPEYPGVMVPSPNGVWVDRRHVLAALEAAPVPDLVEAHDEHLGVWADELMADLVLNGLMDLVDHEYDTKVGARREIIAALKQANQAKVPQPDDDPECTCCGGTGITYQTERRCGCQPVPDLVEAERLTNVGFGYDLTPADRDTIRALIALATAQAAQIAGLTKERDSLKAEVQRWADKLEGTDGLLAASEVKVAELEASALRADQAAKADYAARAKAEAEAATMRDEVERLRGALEFYSCKDGCNDCSENERDLIGCGWTARAALEGKA